MSLIGVASVHDDAPEDNPDHFLYSTKPASTKAINAVLSTSMFDENGRSEWVWVRLRNGDLVLGVFPQGDTYFEHEAEHS
jgi:hypothetical protein